jgi:hypothetical protein
MGLAMSPTAFYELANDLLIDVLGFNPASTKPRPEGPNDAKTVSDAVSLDTLASSANPQSR